jgi:hypothetical protein
MDFIKLIVDLELNNYGCNFMRRDKSRLYGGYGFKLRGLWLSIIGRMVINFGGIVSFILLGVFIYPLLNLSFCQLEGLLFMYSTIIL